MTHPQAVKDFGIMGIPTVLVVSNGKEISRHTGSLNAEQLDILFKAASTESGYPHSPTRIQRHYPHCQRISVTGYGLHLGIRYHFVPAWRHHNF